MEDLTADLKRILIVEDEVLSALSLKGILEISGYQVVALPISGEEAITQTQIHEPDVILMDIKLAGQLDGIETAKRIQKIHDVPIIYMTGYADHAIVQRAKTTTPYGYLLKPINTGELLRAIDMTLFKHEAERRLKVSEQRHRTLFENMPIGLFRTTPEGKVLDANPALVNMLGYPDRETLLASNVISNYVDPADREAWKAQLAEHGTVEKYETRCRTYSGDIIWVHITAQLVEDCYTEGACYEGSMVNITAEKHAQQALKEAHDELELRVQARTAELVETNSRLQEEINERQQAEATLKRYADEQSALYSITSAAAEYLEPLALLNAALDAVIPAVSALGGWVTLPPEHPGSAHQIVTWRGISDTYIQRLKTLPIVPGLPCYAMVQKQHIMDCPNLIMDCPRSSSDLHSQSTHEYTIGVPLRTGNQVLGIMDIVWASKPETADYLQFQSLLIAIGQQIGLALRNAQLYQASQQADRLGIINTISAAAVSSLRLDAILPEILSLTCTAVDSTEGYLFLKDAHTESFIICPVPANQPKRDNDYINAIIDIAKRVARSQETVKLDTSNLDASLQDTLPYLGITRNKSILCVPLVYRDEVTGVFVIIKARPVQFTDDNIAMLEAIASTTVAAIENARLFTATRNRVNELAVLNQTSLAVAASLDLNEVVDTSLGLALDLFDASVAAVIMPATNSNINDLHGKTPLASFDVQVTCDSHTDLLTLVSPHQQSMLRPDVQNILQHINYDETPILQNLTENIQSLMVVPVTTTSGYSGAVVVGSSKPNAYTSENLLALQTLSSMMVVAVDNAYLHTDLKQALEEKEKAQELLVQSEKMSALGRLAASIAHEINNPLQAILGCMMLSQEELHGAYRREKLEGHLDIAVSEVKRISDIVRRMHDFYRHARTQRRHIELHKVIDEVLQLSDKQLQHSAIEVIRDYDVNVTTIRANADHLKQVFLNLILNSMDAMPEGGTLTIHTRLTTQNTILQYSEETPVVQIKICDTGVGMSEEVQNQLFEPFFTTKKSGTGLGLSISYGIIEAHQGGITVSSKQGKGTTFTIELPIQEP